MPINKRPYAVQVKYYVDQLKLPKEQIEKEIQEYKKYCEGKRLPVTDDVAATVWGLRHDINLITEEPQTEMPEEEGGIQPYVNISDAYNMVGGMGLRGYVLLSEKGISRSGKPNWRFIIVDGTGVADIMSYQGVERWEQLGLKDGDTVFLNNISVWKRDNGDVLSMGAYSSVDKVEASSVKLPKYEEALRPTNISEVTDGKLCLLRGLIWKPIERKYMGCSICRKKSNIALIAEGQDAVCDKCGQLSHRQNFMIKGMDISDANKEEISCNLDSNSTVSPKKLVGEIMLFLGTPYMTERFGRQFRAVKLLEDKTVPNKPTPVTEADLEFGVLQINKLSTLHRDDTLAREDMEVFLNMPSSKCKATVTEIIQYMLKLGKIEKTPAGFYKVKE